MLKSLKETFTLQSLGIFKSLILKCPSSESLWGRMPSWRCHGYGLERMRKDGARISKDLLGSGGRVVVGI